MLVDADGDSATPMVPMLDGTTYRVAANGFLSDGGDNFPGFIGGSNKLVGGLDIDSLRLYLAPQRPDGTHADRPDQPAAVKHRPSRGHPHRGWPS